MIIFLLIFFLFSNRFRDSIIRSGRSEKNRRLIDFFRSISDQLTPLLLTKVIIWDMER
jgi:hypothetical protein